MLRPRSCRPHACSNSLHARSHAAVPASLLLFASLDAAPPSYRAPRAEPARSRREVLGAAFVLLALGLAFLA